MSHSWTFATVSSLTLILVLSAGVVAVLLNVILPDNEIVPKDQPPEVHEQDDDVEAQPITHATVNDAESVSSKNEKK